MKKQGVAMRELGENPSEAVIDICGVIGWQVAYTELREMLRKLPESVKRVVFDIYSPGGDVWEGNGIIQEIGELGKRAETVARIQVAASMATLIAVACQKRMIAANGRFLVHNAWTETIGDAAAHEKAAKTLHDAEVEAAAFYALRCECNPKKTPSDMLTLMAEERWLTAQETQAFGFVQEIADPFKEEDVAAVKQELMAAGKWPKALVELPPEQAAEQVEVKDVPAADNGTATVAAIAEKPPEQSADVGSGSGSVQPATNEQIVAARAEGYARGKEDADAANQLARGEYVKRLQEREDLCKQLQSAKDKALAQIELLKKEHLEVCSDYEKRLEVQKRIAQELTEKLDKMLSGGMTFVPGPTTWDEAMRLCNGVYEDAARQYPELKRQYQEQHKARKGK